MTILGAWLRKLVGTAIILGFLELILPEGELQRFARVVMGLLVVLVLLQPLAAILRQDLPLERVLAARDEPAGGRNAQPADGIVAAGLSALQEARRAELEKSIRALCAEAAGVRLSAVDVALDADGMPKIAAGVTGAADARRVKRLIVSHFNLPEAAVEVNVDE
ncbi:MAG: stage III sporulation protein AF [Bacteroidota bacterium]